MYGQLYKLENKDTVYVAVLQYEYKNLYSVTVEPANIYTRSIHTYRFQGKYNGKFVHV
jgi:hypothetical protein